MSWTLKEQGMLATASASTDEKRATRVFVATSSANTTPVAARAATGMPALGDAHPDDSSLLVVNIDAKPAQEESLKVFFNTVEYSNKSDPNSFEPNPLSRSGELSWDFNDGTEKYFIDRSDDEKPVVNSAGERFQELLERATGSLVATFEINIGPTAYSPATALTLKDAVNSDSFTIDGATVEIGQAKIKAWTAGKVQTENGVQFRSSRWVIEFRETWDDVIEDRGFNVLDGGKLKEIIKGTPPVKPDQPWPLDGEGAAKTNADDAPETLTFQPYNRVAYAGLAFVET